MNDFISRSNQRSQTMGQWKPWRDLTRKRDKPWQATALQLMDYDQVKYPIYATPLLEGKRVIIEGGQPYLRKPDRNFHCLEKKGIKNNLVRGILTGLPNFDGYVCSPAMVGKSIRNKTNAFMAKKDAENLFRFWVCDVMLNDPKVPFSERLVSLASWASACGPAVAMAPYVLCYTEAELDAFACKWVDLGAEGVGLRTPDGPNRLAKTETDDWFYAELVRPHHAPTPKQQARTRNIPAAA